MHLTKLLKRITFHLKIFRGKPIILRHQLAFGHVLAMLAAGDDSTTIFQGYPWLEKKDLQACLEYARIIMG